MFSVKRKPNVKSFGKKRQVFRGLEKGPQTKMSLKNIMSLVVKLSSIDITNALKTLQNQCLFHEIGNDKLELLEGFESLHVHHAARK